MILSIPVGFFACWWIDRFGLRSAYYIGAWSNFIGNGVRVLGSASFIDKSWRFPVAFTGQTIAAIAQPFVMFLPTKLAALWFAENERALANTLASMSNPIGIAFMFCIAPVFVNDKHPDNFFWMTVAVASLATFVVLLSFFITSSKPPTPASASRDVNSAAPPFLMGVKRCFKSKTYLVLAVCLGGGVGLFNALYNNLQPALCVKGYSPTFNGLMGGLLIMSGLVGAAITGIIVDKYGQFELVMKVCFCLAGIAAAGLSVAINFEHAQWAIVTVIAVFGAAAFAIFPIGLEMGVEATYPVAEATSTGLIIMIGQVQGVIYVVLTNLVTGKPTPHDLATQTCVNTNGNIKTVLTWEYSFIVWLCIIFLLILLFVTCFWPKYKRREYEMANRNSEKTLQPLEIEDNDIREQKTRV
ncbi:hypothetical protein WR25_25473 isoform B [Diploscapter pachys]|nr:hypothetical protein WR25_25473 isoform B [Diploscapter pachys]